MPAPLKKSSTCRMPPPAGAVMLSAAANTIVKGPVFDALTVFEAVAAAQNGVFAPPPPPSVDEMVTLVVAFVPETQPPTPVEPSPLDFRLTVVAPRLADAPT